MSNAFIQLPAPVGNGNGTAVNVSSLGAVKTVLLDGTFEGNVGIEVSADGGTTWANVARVSTETFLPITVAADFMRMTVFGYVSGTPVVYVGGFASGTKKATIAATASDGSGASTNISTFGGQVTLVSGGNFTGEARIEASDDGTNWSLVETFVDAGYRTLTCYATFLRCTRVNCEPVPGLPVLSVVAADDPASAAAGAAGALVAGSPLLNVVFRPGDPAGSRNNVYTTWAQTYAALQSTAGLGFRILVFDDTYGTVSIPAGLWNMDSVEWSGYLNVTGPGAGGRSVVHVLPGAQFTKLRRFGGFLEIFNENTTSIANPASDLVGTLDTYRFGNNASGYGTVRMSQQAGALPFLDFSGKTGFINLTASTLRGATPAVLMDATSVLTIAIFGIGQVNANMISAPVGATLTVNDSSSETFFDNQTTTFLGTLQKSVFMNQYAGILNPRRNATTAGDIVPSTVPVVSFLGSDAIQLNNSAGVAPMVQLLPPSGAAAGPGSAFQNQASTVVIKETGNGVHGISVTPAGTDLIDGLATAVYVPPGSSKTFMIAGKIGAIGQWRTISAYKNAATAGTGDAIGGTAPVMTLTDAGAAFNEKMVGCRLTIAGATTGANNGTFVITGFTSATVVSYLNAAGVAEAFTGTYTVRD